VWDRIAATPETIPVPSGTAKFAEHCKLCGYYVVRDIVGADPHGCNRRGGASLSVRKRLESLAGEIVVVVAVVALPVLIPLATFVRSSSLARCVRVPASAARYVLHSQPHARGARLGRSNPLRTI
jgi:hypothetical protein